MAAPLTGRSAKKNEAGARAVVSVNDFEPILLDATYISSNQAMH